MSLWRKDGTGAFRLDNPIEYKGVCLSATDQVGAYIEKWLIRHNYKITSKTVMILWETDTHYEEKVIAFSVSKYSIHRTIHLLDTISDCKQYLALFDKYYEDMRELNEKGG